MTDPLYLDDISAGDSFESDTHEMTVENIVAYARQFDPQPFHTDPDAAEDTFFRGLAASGWHTAAVTMRLLVDAVPLAKGMIGAGGDIHWPTPTRPGDVLRVTATIEEIVPSRSKPGRAAVTMLSRTTNQHGELRQEFRCRLMAWQRDADPQS